MRVKIKEGVARGLCGSCDNSFIREDQKGQVEVWCHYFHPMRSVGRPIVECSGHEEKGKMSKHDMDRVAWILEVKAGRVVGFQPPIKSQGLDQD